MFTGDRSGDWLYGALHRAGLADRAESVARDDGLTLRDVFISATCRCAPPGNRPTRPEMDRCAPFFDRELELLAGLRVVVALGQIGWEAALRCSARVAPAQLARPRPRFGHGAEACIRLRGGADPVWLLGSYHPSQQNTQTGRLTRPMFDSVIARAVELAAAEA
jgi:uracil-DNA glycosylase family 4